MTVHYGSMQLEKRQVEVASPIDQSTVTTTFNGDVLTIAGSTVYEFEGREQSLARLLLHRTLITPNLPVYPSQIRTGRIGKSAEALISSVAFIDDLYEPVVGWRPLLLETEPASRDVRVAKHVTFFTKPYMTAVLPDKEVSSLEVGHATVQLEQNKRWYSALRAGQQKFATVPFERMNPDVVTIFALLNGRSGQEMDLATLRVLFEGKSSKRVSDESFTLLMQNAVKLYQNIPELQERISFRTRVIDGNRQGFFSWKRI